MMRYERETSPGKPWRRLASAGLSTAFLIVVGAALVGTVPSQFASADAARGAARGASAPAGQLRWHVVRRTRAIPASVRPFIHSASIALSADARWLMVGGSATGVVSVLDAATLERKSTLRTGGDATDRLESVSEGRVLAWATTGHVYGFLQVNRAKDLFVIDASAEPQVVGRMQLGMNLGEVVGLGGNLALVPSVGSNRLSLVDTKHRRTLEQVRTREHGFTPVFTAIRDDLRIGVVTGGYFRGSSPRGDELLVLDPMAPATRSRFEFYRGLAHPREAVFLPDGRHILVANRGSDSLLILDWVDRRTVAERVVGDRPEFVGLMPDGRRAWVTYGSRSTDRKITFVDIATGRFDDVALPGHTNGRPVFSANGSELYVPLQNNDGVAVLDPAAQQLVDFVRTPGAAQAIVGVPDGTKIYVVQDNGKQVSLLE
jgi:YVTN family beta-propeller protein